MFKKIIRLTDRIIKSKYAHAHCDIPCGIYDPHQAQVAAHTVFRMTQLIKDSENPHDISRFSKIKEDHAEICKNEIRIIWGDYFKSENIGNPEEVHNLVWKIMKSSSKTKQNVDIESCSELLEDVMKFSEIFWKSKNIETKRVKSSYPTEKDMVYPVLS